MIIAIWEFEYHHYLIIAFDHFLYSDEDSGDPEIYTGDKGKRIFSFLLTCHKQFNDYLFYLVEFYCRDGRKGPQYGKCEKVGEGTVCDRTRHCHGNKLRDDEIKIKVDSLIYPGYQHPDYNYELEVNGYAAWLATLLEKLH